MFLFLLFAADVALVVGVAIVFLSVAVHVLVSSKVAAVVLVFWRVDVAVVLAF